MNKLDEIIAKTVELEFEEDMLGNLSDYPADTDFNEQRLNF